MKRLKVLLHALGFKRYTLFGVSTGVSVLYAWFQNEIDRAIGIPLPSFSGWFFFLLTTAIISCICLIEEVLALRKKLEPRIKFDFSNNDPFVRRGQHVGPMLILEHETIKQTTKYCQARVLLINLGQESAEGCRAYLNDIQRRDSNGSYLPTTFGESLRLAWSARDDSKYASIVLYKGIKQFVDVFQTNEASSDIHLFTEQLLDMNKDIFREPGIYRLYVSAVSKNAGSDELVLELDWTGKWDQFQLRIAGP